VPWINFSKVTCCAIPARQNIEKEKRSKDFFMFWVLNMTANVGPGYRGTVKPILRKCYDPRSYT
jgi:hypothetical protein